MPAYPMKPPEGHHYFCHPTGPDLPHMELGEFSCLANHAVAVIKFQSEERQDDWSEGGQAIVCTLYKAVVQCVFPTELIVGVVTTKAFYEANPVLGKVAKVCGAYVPMAVPGEPPRMINCLMLDDCVPLRKTKTGWQPLQQPASHESEAGMKDRLKDWRNLMKDGGSI